MRKRIVSGVLVLVILLSSTLTGCSNTKSEESTSMPTVEQPTVTPSSEPSSDKVQDETSVPTATVTPEPTAPSEPEPTVETTVEPTLETTEPPTEPPIVTEPKEETDEFGLTDQQRNSYSMLYFLAITAEEIRISSDNSLILDDIYTSLFNDINPGAIDETTQTHLENLRDIIEDYIDISTKRERLQFIYNQEKAASIRSAVPNPLSILSMTNSLDWRKMATSVVYTVVDSYNNYKKASEAADMEFLMNGWELDDEATEAMRKNRRRAFNYMVDIVQEYALDGKLTLSESAIETFAEICGIEALQEKIRRLESAEGTYQLLGNYWLELADCYFEAKQYKKCLECVEAYNNLATGIYRKDYNYVRILPKAIVAAQNTSRGSAYITTVATFADDIIENTDQKEWSVRYFAAQTYLDLYARTNDRTYLEKAYDIAYDNMTVLLDDQRELNSIYLAEVKEVPITEPDYRYMTEAQKKDAERKFNEEKKRLKAYNKELKDARATELPPLYEPLVLNCDLLFALAEEMNIGRTEQRKIEDILQVGSNGIFLSDIINDRYSFSDYVPEYSIQFDQNRITIPASLLSSESAVVVKVTDGVRTTTFDDYTVTEVKREGSAVDTFTAYYTSKLIGEYTWSTSCHVTVEIHNGNTYEPSIFKYKVVEYKDNWVIADKVVFEEV